MGQIKTPTLFTPEELVVVGLDVLAGDGVGDGPRQEEEPVIDERLVLNIMALGVIEPVVIRRRTDGRMEVVEGRRRVRAAREVNLRLKARGEDPIRVPVVLRTGADADLFAVAYAGNEFGRGNSVLTRAWLVREYLNRGRSIQDAATRFVVTPHTIENWISLLETSPKVQAAVQRGELTVSGALELSSLPPDQQDVQLEQLLHPLVAQHVAPESMQAILEVVAEVEAEAKGNGRVGNAPESPGRKKRVSGKAVKEAVAGATGAKYIDPPGRKLLKACIACKACRDQLNSILPAVLLQWVVGEIDWRERADLKKLVDLAQEDRG